MNRGYDGNDIFEVDNYKIQFLEISKMLLDASGVKLPEVIPISDAVVDTRKKNKKRPK